MDRKNARTSGRGSKAERERIKRKNEKIQKSNRNKIIFFLILLVFAIIGFVTVIGKILSLGQSSQTTSHDSSYMVGGDAQSETEEPASQDEIREAMTGITSKEGFTDKLQNILVAGEDTEIYSSTDDGSGVTSKVEAGDYVKFYGSEDGWCKLTYKEYKGYGKAEYFEDLEDDKAFKVVDGALIVNDEYYLPEDYDPGMSIEAQQSFELMKSDMERDNMYLDIVTSYVTYGDQKTKYDNRDLSEDGNSLDRFIQEPGHSEHQTGLAIDVTNDITGEYNEEFHESKEYEWLSKNAYKYGFIERYPRGKQEITGMEFQPWHLRYLGPEMAKKIYNSGLTIEEYYDL